MRKAFFAALAALGLAAHAQTIELPLMVTSPDGRIQLLFDMTEAGEPVYSITQAGDTVVGRSLMGFESRKKFQNGVSGCSRDTVDESYTLPHGKCSTYHNTYHALTVDLRGAGTARNMSVEFRVFDDAVAFRYTLKIGTLTSFSGEVTEFNFPSFKQALALEYSDDYTWYYYLHPWTDLTNERGYNEPLLVETNHDGRYVLITEAANFGETGGNSIIRGDREGQLKLTGINKSETGVKSAISSYPFATPWRTLIMGTVQDIVASTTVLNLNEPTTLTDMSWCIPGRVAWNWAGEDRQNTGSIEVAKQYVDLAAYLGWEYVLIDDGWEGHIDLDAFLAYCRQKEVGALLWFNNNKFSSDYASCLSTFKTYAQKGVKGLKIDFFDGDDQQVIQKYETLMRAAAAAGLLLDFHGCTRPTGWERKYPNLMTMEAVLGGEFFLGEPHMNPAKHSVNVLLGRNVQGSMDFTPTRLGQRTGAITHQVTWSYELALWSLFESGFQCLIDNPDNIIDSPIEPALRCIPAAWDETRCIEAVPDQYATLARRSGESWFVATVSQNQRTMTLPLKFLDADKEYTAYIYRDGDACSFDIKFEKRVLNASNSLTIKVKAGGGATVILSPKDDLPYPMHTSYEAETACLSGVKQTNDNCSGKAYKTGFSGTTRGVFRKITAPVAGEYALTIYHLSSETSNTAYIQVGTGEKQYYTFHTKDTYDSQKGLVLAMKTVYVQLEAGTNVITYGNENGTAPDLDKITVTPTLKTRAVIDGIETAEAVPENANNTALRCHDGKVECHCMNDGVLSIFDLSGHLVEQHNVSRGVTSITPRRHGTFVLSLNSGARAFSRKVRM